MEIIVAALAEAIFSVLISDLYQRDSFANLREKLQGGSKEKGALQDALTKALERFKERFPELEAAFFDEHFLLSNGGVAAELAKLLTPNLSPEPETLARLWRAQFSTLQSDELLGPVSSFLEYLRDEINSQPSLKPFIDSRALYQLHKIADHGEQQVMLLGEMVETFSHVRDAMSNLSRQADPVTLPTTALGATPSLTSLSDTQTNSDSTQSLTEDF